MRGVRFQDDFANKPQGGFRGLAGKPPIEI
jgi:hypothetical protein